MVSAVASSLTSIDVNFSKPMGDSATDVANYSIEPALIITAASLNADKTVATLITSPQSNISYTLTVAGVKDADGNDIDANANTATFEGMKSNNPNDKVRPKVETAISSSNTEFTITFSEAMDASVENIANYQITAPNPPEPTSIQPQAATLVLKSAKRSADLIQVTFETFSQSAVAYSVKVVNVRDVAGNIIDPTGTEVSFNGLPESGSAIDTDKDGLSDVKEQRGWWVIVKDGDTEVDRQHVTSDPNSADTDKDGLTDDSKEAQKLNPRTEDTDGDTISDKDEVQLYGSNADNKDSDKDSVSDEEEVAQGSSPQDVDSDGDTKPDNEDPKPAFADLPSLAIDFVGEPSISLDITFDNGNKFSFEKTTGIAIDTSSEFTKSDTVANQTSVENSKSVTASATVSAGLPPGGSVSVSGTLSQTKSYAQEKSYTVDRTSAQSIQKQNNLLEAQSQNTNVKTSGGSITQGIKLVNTGNLAFRVQDLSLSVLYRDPKTPGAFQSIATLQAESDISNVVLGTSDSVETGVINFSTKTIGNVLLLRSFLANPNALIFSVATRTLLNKDNQPFAFVEESIDAKTAFVVVDFGNGTVVRERIATTLRQDGILPLPKALKSLGLSYTSTARKGSKNNTNFPNGVKVLDSITMGSTTVKTDASTKSFWYLLTPDSELADPNKNFDDLTLKAGNILYLVYDRDVDDDGIMARDEYLAGSSDTDKDSDDDGISDFDELKVGWDISVSGETQRVFSDPSNADADEDGINDWEEMMGCLDNDDDKVCDTDFRQPATDPNKADTDANGETDGNALTRYEKLVFVKQFGGADQDIGVALATDGNDNMYLAWSSRLVSNLSFPDVHLAKYDAEGKEIWTKVIVVVADKLFVRDIVADASGNVYVISQTGAFKGGTLTKFNTDGIEQWEKTFSHDVPFPGQQPNGIATDNNGNVYVTGSQWFYDNGNIMGQDIFLIKYNSGGTKLWTKVTASSEADVAEDVTTNGDNVYVTGYTEGSLNGFSNKPVGKKDAFILTYDGSGDLTSIDHLGVPGNGGGNPEETNEHGLAISYNSSCGGGNGGPVQIVGYTDIVKHGGKDAFRYPTAVNVIDQFGTAADDEAVALTPGGFCFHRAGNTKGNWLGTLSNAGGSDIFVDNILLGSDKDDFVTDITTTSKGIFVTGYTTGSLFTNSNSGDTDAFLIRISP